jgi:hypothetical protein
MYDACDPKYGKREIQWEKATRERRTQGRYAQHKSTRTRQDIADFISVSVYTGLRISDVSTFHIYRITPYGTIQLRTTKAHTHGYTWVPQYLLIFLSSYLLIFLSSYLLIFLSSYLLIFL